MKLNLLRLLAVTALGCASATAVTPTPTPRPSLTSGIMQRANGSLIAAGPILLSDPALGGTLPAARLPAETQSASSVGYRDYAADATKAIDGRIAGKTANTATYNLFSVGDFSFGGSFTRNPALWCADIDLSCLSPWNSVGGPTQGGTLITPRHVVLANHFSSPSQGSAPMTPGVTRISFAPSDGTATIQRTITSFAQVAGTDILIGTLDSDVPAKIIPAQVLPAGLPSGVFPVGSPVLYINRQKEAHVADLSFETSGIASSTGSLRSPWTVSPTPAVVGDSGSPVFLVLNGKPVLLFAFLSPGGGPALSENIAAINVILGAGYSLALAPVNIPTADAIQGLGTAAKLDQGTDVGQIPVVGSDGKLPSGVIPGVSTAGAYIEQPWSGQGAVLLDSATTALRLTSSTVPVTNILDPLKINLTYNPVDGRSVDIVLPPFTGGGVGIYAGGAVVTSVGPSGYGQIIHLVAGAGSWKADTSLARNGAPINSPILVADNFQLNNQIQFSDGQLTVFNNDGHANFTAGIWTVNPAGKLAIAPVTPGQSMRFNAAGTAFEGYSPMLDNDPRAGRVWDESNAAPALSVNDDQQLVIADGYSFAGPTTPGLSITPAGTTGDQTINAYAGTIRLGSDASSAGLSNSKITAATKFRTVQAQGLNSGTVLTATGVVDGIGHATIYISGSVTATEIEVYWELAN